MVGSRKSSFSLNVTDRVFSGNNLLDVILSPPASTDHCSGGWVPLAFSARSPAIPDDRIHDTVISVWHVTISSADSQGTLCICN